MNRKILSNITSCLLILCFVIFLYIGMAVTITRDKETYSYFENRNLAALPEISEEGVLDGTYFSDIDTYIKEHAAGRNTVLKASTVLDMYVLKRPVVNDVVICDDVLLPYKDYETVDEDKINIDAQAIAGNLKSHSDLTESYGGKFYYVAVPCQYVCYKDSYPWYLNNRNEYTEKSTSALFGNLDELGVSYIDMMEWYENAGCPEYFSSTVDNHFSIFGAYETYLEIINKIRTDTGLELDVLERDEFTTTTLPNYYLGSRSRKIFGMWGSDEKLSIITPNDSVTFDRWNYGNKGTSIVYSLPKDDIQDVKYTMYMGGDISNTAIKTYREELPSILIYGDSFTNAVECIAWYSFDTMYSLDYRYYNGENLETFIAENKPDIVVCIRDYEALLTRTANGQ